MTPAQENFFASSYRDVKNWMAGADGIGLMVKIVDTCYYDFRLACKRYLQYPTDGNKALVNEVHRDAVASVFTKGLVDDPEKFCQRIWEEEKAKAMERIAQKETFHAAG